MFELVQMDNKDRWNFETVLVDFEDGNEQETWDGLVKTGMDIQRMRLLGEERAIMDALVHKMVRYGEYTLLLSRMVDASKDKHNIELLKQVLRWVERGNQYLPEKWVRVTTRRTLVNNYLKQGQLF